MRSVVALEMKRVGRRLAEKDIKIETTEAALDWIAEVGYDPQFGARPLKRTIQREVETAIAKGILRGDFVPNSMIVVDADAVGGLTIVGRALPPEEGQAAEGQAAEGEESGKKTGPTLLRV